MKLKGKKSIGTGTLIAAVIGAIILILFIGGPLQAAYRITKDQVISKVIPPKAVNESQFVPYVATLSDEEKTVLDSMNALVCAINTVTAGKINLKQNCPGIQTIAKTTTTASTPTTQAMASLTGEAVAEYCPLGSNKSCISCTEDSKKNKKITPAPSKALETIGQEILSCWADSNDATEVMLCSIIKPGGFTENDIVTQQGIRDWLKNFGGDAGTDIIGAGGMFDRDNFYWDSELITRFAKNNVYPGLDILIYADNSGLNRIHVRPSNSNPVYPLPESVKLEYFAPISNSFCKVTSFEMPQKIEKKSFFNPVVWVAGHGDPQYLAYYESFPEGMDKFWHVDAISVASVGMIVGFAALDVIPFVGKALKTTATEAKAGAKQLAKNLASDAMQSIIGLFTGTAWKRAYRQVIIEQTFANSWHGVGEGIAKTAAKEVDDVVGSLAEKMSKESVQEVQQKLQQSLLEKIGTKITKIDEEFKFARVYNRPAGETLEQAETAALREYREKVTKEMAEQTITLYSAKLTKQFLKGISERAAVRNMFKELLDETGEKFSQQAISDAISKASKKFVSLTAKEQEIALEKGMLLSQEILGQDGLIDAAKLGITAETKEIAQVSLKKQLADEFLTAIGSDEGEKLSQMVAKTGWTMAKGLKQGTVGPGTWNWMLDLLPVSLAKPVATDLVPAVGWLKYAVKSGVKTFGDLPGWMVRHKYPVIAAFAFYAAAADQANEKYKPVGTNALAVTTSSLTGEKAEFSLLPELANYYVATKDQRGNIRRERMYLVSPCKADLTFKVELCTCNRMPALVQHFKFVEGYPPQDVRGITLDTELLSDDSYINEAFNKANPESWFLTASEQEVVDRIKPQIDNSQSSFQEKDIYLREKYPILTKFPAKDIRTRKQAIAARERYNAVQFFEYIVNAVDGGGEETGYLAKSYYNYNAQFYDMNSVSKECFDRGFINDAIDVLKGGFKTTWSAVTSVAGGAATFTVKEEAASFNDNVFMHPTFKIPCVTVSLTRDPTYKKETGANYCIDEYPQVETARYVFIAAQLAISLVVTAATGGAATPILLATSGITLGVMEELIARNAKWPSYADEADRGEVPIAQKSVTDSDWSAWGGPQP